MKRLPHCDELFTRYFDRWYHEDDRRRREFKATRPDLLQSPAHIGMSASELCTLTPDTRAEVQQQLLTMLDAARSDWKGYLHVEEPVSLEGIAAFDAYYDAMRVLTVLRASDPADYTNDYVIICCELGAVLGRVLIDQDATLSWLLDWPYWDSAIFSTRTGHILPVFHWAIKKMSSYGIDDGLDQKVQAALARLSKRAHP